MSASSFRAIDFRVSCSLQHYDGPINILLLITSAACREFYWVSYEHNEPLFASPLTAGTYWIQRWNCEGSHLYLTNVFSIHSKATVYTKCWRFIPIHEKRTRMDADHSLSKQLMIINSLGLLLQLILSSVKVLSQIVNSNVLIIQKLWNDEHAKDYVLIRYISVN